MQQQNAFLPPKLTQNIRKRCMHVLSPNEFVSVSGAKPCIRKNSQAATLLPQPAPLWVLLATGSRHLELHNGYQRL